MVRDIKVFEGAVVEFTKILDCGVNVFKLSGPKLLDAKKEGEGELKECPNLIFCGLDKGKRRVFDEKMNDFIEVLFFI
jgi:hypothetical protein